ncbi:HTH-type transcriptional regulator immR, partial [Dysosmobacter welbionis]
RSTFCGGSARKKSSHFSLLPLNCFPFSQKSRKTRPRPLPRHRSHFPAITASRITSFKILPPESIAIAPPVFQEHDGGQDDCRQLRGRCRQPDPGDTQNDREDQHGDQCKDKGAGKRQHCRN